MLQNSVLDSNAKIKDSQNQNLANGLNFFGGEEGRRYEKISYKLKKKKNVVNPAHSFSKPDFVNILSSF